MIDPEDIRAQNSLEAALDILEATGDRMAAELMAARDLNRELIAALQRATAILKSWADNDVVSDQTLMEMTDEVIPLCDAVLSRTAGGVQ